MTLAAEELGVTVSAISHQIAGLEKALGATLIERGSKPLRLTSIGMQYAERLRVPFELIHEATADLFVRQQPHQVRVTTYPLMAVKWLLPRLQSFRERHPHIDLSLTSTHRVVALQTGEADVAIRLGRGPWKDCTATRLMPDKVVVVCAPRLLRKGMSSRQVLETIPLIAWERGQAFWPRWLEANGFSAVPAVHGPLFDDPLGALEAAIAGAGLALTLRGLAEADIRAGRLTQALPSVSDLHLSHYVVMSVDAAMRPAVRTFVEWLATQPGA